MHVIKVTPFMFSIKTPCGTLRKLKHVIKFNRFSLDRDNRHFCVPRNLVVCYNDDVIVMLFFYVREPGDVPDNKLKSLLRRIMFH